MIRSSHLQHLLPLHPLVTHVDPGPPIALVVTDTLGDLRGLQLLEAVALGAAPLVDLLQKRSRCKGGQ